MGKPHAARLLSTGQLRVSTVAFEWRDDSVAHPKLRLCKPQILLDLNALAGQGQKFWQNYLHGQSCYLLAFCGDWTAHRFAFKGIKWRLLQRFCEAFTWF